MSAVALSLVTLASILIGILIGILLRHVLPDRHLADDTKDVVRLGTGLVGTMAALVLGLLIASAKSSYDAQSVRVTQITAEVILLDALLTQYGPEARPERELLRQGVAGLVDRVWQKSDSRNGAAFASPDVGRALYSAIMTLSPRTDEQTALKSQAAQAFMEIAQARLLLFAQADGAIPLPFLVVLVFWLTIIFASFSLFARPTPIGIGALIIFALSATGAVYLILELTTPFEGLMQISSDRLATALPPLNR